MFAFSLVLLSNTTPSRQPLSSALLSQTPISVLSHFIIKTISFDLHETNPIFFEFQHQRRSHTISRISNSFAVKRETINIVLNSEQVVLSHVVTCCLGPFPSIPSAKRHDGLLGASIRYNSRHKNHLNKTLKVLRLHGARVNDTFWLQTKNEHAFPICWMCLPSIIVRRCWWCLVVVIECSFHCIFPSIPSSASFITSNVYNHQSFSPLCTAQTLACCHSPFLTILVGANAIEKCQEKRILQL